MSNIPSLLRQQAEGLRKEAEESATSVETAFYAATELLKQAENSDDYYYKQRMLHAAEAQAKAAQAEADATNYHARQSAVNSRIATLTPEDIAELKAKIAAMEGQGKAYNSAREAAPVSTLKRALVGAGVGGLATSIGGVTALPGAIIGGLIGAGNGSAAKHRYGVENFGQGEHLHAGLAHRDYLLDTLGKSDVERRIHTYAEDYDAVPSHSVEEAYDSEPGYKDFYKKASFNALQDMVNSGQIDAEVAQATLDELELRMA